MTVFQWLGRNCQEQLTVSLSPANYQRLQTATAAYIAVKTNEFERQLSMNGWVQNLM